MNEWNKHRIRRSRGTLSVSGIPDELYFLPSVRGNYNNYITNIIIYTVYVGVRNYLCSSYSTQNFHTAQAEAEAPSPPASYEFLIIFKQVLHHLNLLFPLNVQEAITVYVAVSDYLNELVFE